MFELLLENTGGRTVNINDGENFVVVEFEGLTPPAASLYTSKSPNRKGSNKNGSTLDERTVIIQIKLLGDIEVNRNYLYDWTDTETELKVHYRNGVKRIYCEGTVTECDIPICSDNEIVTVAIVCTDPFLKDLQEVEKEISSLLKQFTFPFSIDAKGIPFSTLRDDNRTNIYNTGAETGVVITITALNEVSNITLYNANDVSKVFSINMTLAKNEIIKIDTNRSPRTVKIYRVDGRVENILKYVGHNPTWFQLKKGNNLFGYTASDTSNIEVKFTFTVKYLGV